MLVSLMFFAISCLWGLVCINLLKIHVLGIMKYALALIFGVVFLSLVIFLTGFIFGLTPFISYTIFFVALVISIPYVLRNPSSLKGFDTFDFKKNYLEIFCFLIIFIVLFFLFYKSVFITPSSVVAGNRLVWTDWPIHFAIIASFVHGNNFPPQNPQHPGQFMTYSFFSDFISAVLQTLGANFKSSLVIPGIVLGFASSIIIYYFGRLVVASKTSVLALFIGFFWGGLGFIYFVEDILTSLNPLKSLTFPPHEYTFYSEKNLWFFSFLYSELLSQRAFLLGLPLFFASIFFLILGSSNNRKTYLFIASLAASPLPLFHFHSYLSLVIFSAVFVPLTLFSKLIEKGFLELMKSFSNIIIYFGLPTLGFSLLQFPLFSSINTAQTIYLNWGWMAKGENFLVFWLKNTGFFWPLFILGLFIFRKDSLKRNIAIAASALFIIPNIISFAPWPYDNLKVLTYFYLIGAFFVAASIVFIAKKGFIGKIIAVLLFVSLTLSGAIEVARALNTEKVQISIWSEKDFEIAKAMIKNTEPTSTILTAAIHDNPVSGIAGRKQVIGFPGNSWSWGFADWFQREQDVRTMLIANSLSVEFLLRKYHINYVLISDRERYFEPQVNEKYYEENAIFVAGGPNYKIYKLPWQAP